MHSHTHRNAHTHTPIPPTRTRRRPQLAAAFAATGNAGYAQQAAAAIRAWATTNRAFGISYRNGPLEAAWSCGAMARAAELLRTTKGSGFGQAQVGGCLLLRACGRCTSAAGRRLQTAAVAADVIVTCTPRPVTQVNEYVSWVRNLLMPNMDNYINTISRLEIERGRKNVYGNWCAAGGDALMSSRVKWHELSVGLRSVHTPGQLGPSAEGTPWPCRAPRAPCPGLHGAATSRRLARNRA